MKIKLISLLLALVIVGTVMTACGSSDENMDTSVNNIETEISQLESTEKDLSESGKIVFKAFKE